MNQDLYDSIIECGRVDILLSPLKNNLRLCNLRIAFHVLIG